jgi:hypothetical protein
MEKELTTKQEDQKNRLDFYLKFLKNLQRKRINVNKTFNGTLIHKRTPLNKDVIRELIAINKAKLKIITDNEV